MNLKSQLPKAKYNGFGNITLLFWFIFLVILILLNGVLKLILIRIFPFILKTNVSNLTFHDLIKNCHKTTIYSSKILAVNLSGESDVEMKKYIRQNGFKCTDISNSQELKNWMVKGNRIVLLNLDEAINNLELFRKKNDLLGKLVRLNQKQIVISSTRSPKQIIEYYSKIKEQEGIDKNFIDQEISRFSKLIAQFQVFYCSLNEVSQKTQPKTNFLKLLNRELSPDTFLYSFKNTLINIYHFKNNECSKEDVILKIQDMASEFYEKLWNSFKLERKNDFI